MIPYIHLIKIYSLSSEKVAVFRQVHGVSKDSMQAYHIFKC